MIFKTTDPLLDLVEVDVASTCFLTAKNNKIFKYLIQGGNLSSTINASFNNPDFQISTDSVSGFAASLLLTPVNGVSQQAVYAKYMGNTVGVQTATLTVSTTGAPTQTASLSISFKKDAFGRGNAMAFDGTNDRVALTGLNWQPTKFTVEFWYKPNDVYTYWNHWIGNTGQFFMHSDGTKIIKMGIENTNESTIVTPSNMLLPNQWIHIAFTFNQGTASMYLNGKLFQTKSGVAMPSAWNNLNLGQSGSNSLNGQMDEFRIWSVDRTEQQIQENMHLINDLNAACSEGLKLYYQFENNAGGITEDALGTYNGTIADSPTLVVSSAPVGFGKSQTNVVNAAGTFDYPNSHASLNFSGTIPSGKVVVTELYDAPFAPPAGVGTRSGTYWLVNNYGANTGLTATLNVSPASGFINNTTPGNYKFYKRESNGFGAWSSAILSSAVSSTQVSVATTSFSQFVLFNDVTCVEFLNLTNDPVNYIIGGVKVFKTSKSSNTNNVGLIRASNSILGGNTTYDSGKKIELLPGFIADASNGNNTVFSAIIGGCGE